MWLFYSLLLLPALCAAQEEDIELEVKPTAGMMLADLTLQNVPAIFECSLPSDDLGLTLKWFHPDKTEITATSGRVMVERPNPTTLRVNIGQVKEADKGVYTCKAEGGGKTAEAVFNLQVYTGYTFHSNETQYPTFETDAKIYCKVRSSITFEISWYKLNADGQRSNIPIGEKFFPRDDYLLVKNIQLNDTSMYQCLCSNTDMGKSRSFKINVIVTIPPSFTGPITQVPMSPKESDNLELTCQAKGTPAPTYTFWKDGQQLTQDPLSDGRFVLENIQRAQGGTYKCIASNFGGQADQTVNVNIFVSPTIDTIPNVTKPSGARVEIPCVAKGDPKPAVSWRRQDGLDVYPFTPTENDGIFVTESPEVQEGEFAVSKVTLTLTIPVLKPEDAFQYVCSATNKIGADEKKVTVDVMYAPNFDSQDDVGRHFYGWRNGDSELTCIANGNPKPVVTWERNGVTIKGDQYSIRQAQEDHLTQTISYLTPRVEGDAAVFGFYTCKAVNKFNPEGAKQDLEFREAKLPGPPERVEVTSASPRVISLSIHAPRDNGGLPVQKYSIKTYILGQNRETAVESEAPAMPSENVVMASIRDLQANTNYSIEVSAVTPVGHGLSEATTGLTKAQTVPGEVQVNSDRNGDSGRQYSLSWTVPADGGAPLLGYLVKFAKIEVEDAEAADWVVLREPEVFEEISVDKGRTQQQLTGLDRDSFYKVKVSAINSIGPSPPTVFIFKTAKGGEASVGDDGPALGTGGILGLLILLLLVLAIAVDAAFCVTKQCGVMWTIRQAVASKDEDAPVSSKSPEDGDEAATKLLGKDKEDSLKTENELAKEAEPAEEVGTEMQGRELEPEDKEEKPSDPVKEDAPEEKAKTLSEPETPAPPAPEAKEPTVESTPAVETKPAVEDKTDGTTTA